MADDSAKSETSKSKIMKSSLLKTPEEVTKRYATPRLCNRHQHHDEGAKKDPSKLTSHIVLYIFMCIIDNILKIWTSVLRAQTKISVTFLNYQESRYFTRNNNFTEINFVVRSKFVEKSKKMLFFY